LAVAAPRSRVISDDIGKLVSALRQACHEENPK
jgi:hypothetical protein